MKSDLGTSNTPVASQAALAKFARPSRLQAARPGSGVTTIKVPKDAYLLRVAIYRTI